MCLGLNNLPFKDIHNKEHQKGRFFGVQAEFIRISNFGSIELGQS